MSARSKASAVQTIGPAAWWCRDAIEFLWTFVLWASLAAAMLMLGASGFAHAAVPKASNGYKVDIRNFAFAPKTLTVPAGARVVWTNRDEEPHVVTSAGSLFVSSKALDTGDSYTTTFSKPGVYAYYCAIHPMMTGVVIVK